MPTPLPTRLPIVACIASLAALFGACASVGPNCSDGACEEGLVCGSDALCHPASSAARSDLRFTTPRALMATDWVSIARGSRALHADVLPVGGQAQRVALLRFDLPGTASDTGGDRRDDEVVAAELVLRPHVDHQPVAEAIFSLDRVRPFRSEDPPRSSPRSRESGVRRHVRAGDTLRFDVTELVRAAHGETPRVLYLRLKVSSADDALFRLASPTALDSGSWPRLDLHLR